MLKADIQANTADIEANTAEAQKLTKEIAELDEDTVIWNGDIEAATKVREIEKAGYAPHKDYSKSVDAYEFQSNGVIEMREKRLTSSSPRKPPLRRSR